MFTKLSALALLASTQLALADPILRIGYFTGLAPSLPGPEPTIACAFFARLDDSGSSATPTYISNGGEEPTDDCPFWENALFCDRWGCPFEMTFADVIDVVVQSDKHDDGSLSVTATGLGGGSKTVSCPKDVQTIIETDFGTTYQTWSCDFTGL
ncbi:hypothetical protein BJY04DRAFT_224559 [Aspergillus karnatakaensis]|uniref:uncharacterized protein n=1 Tax=Aspergillus karnatakaensis TaxID=1810916 RepID=UPI003CCD2589